MDLPDISQQHNISVVNHTMVPIEDRQVVTAGAEFYCPGGGSQFLGDDGRSERSMLGNLLFAAVPISFLFHTQTNNSCNANSIISFISREQRCRTSAVLKRLDQIEQQLAHGTEPIARQRKKSRRTDGSGVDTDAMQSMVVGLENQLIFHLHEREKLRAELAKLEGRF
jgi:hypothetical protein